MLKYFKVFLIIIYCSYDPIFGQSLESLDRRTIDNISRRIGVPSSDIKNAISNNKNKMSILSNDGNFSDTLNSQTNSEIIEEIDKTFIDDKINTLNDSDKKISVDVKSDNQNSLHESVEKEKNISVDDIEYFGYDIFNQDPKLFEKSTDISIDPNYLIGPGDEIVIMLWGETEINDSYVVSREGYLFIDNIGQVFVNGLTINLLEKKLFKLFLKSYSSLGAKTGIDKTYFDVSLGKMVHRPIRIFALGELDQPGAYSVKSNSTLFTSLYYFNGPDEKGTLRNIKLIRGSKEISTIDLYDFILSGKRPNDIRLQRDDIIFISNRGKTIHVKGEINRPHIYELKDGETLSDLIKIAGGIIASTYTKRAQITRILDPINRQKLKTDKTIIDVNLNSIITGITDLDLFDNDKIEFFKISDKINNSVKIVGSINRPGSYELSDNMSLNDLINKADGLTSEAYLEKADITRLDENEKETLLSVDLNALFDDPNSNDLLLKADDKVQIYDLNQLQIDDNVFINGHVLYPGAKKFKRGMTLYDLVFMGGGFLNEDHLRDTYFERAEIRRWNSKRSEKELIIFRMDSLLNDNRVNNQDLLRGDSVLIFSKSDIDGYIPNEVIISGFAKSPGKYKIAKGQTIKDLLIIAGGINDDKHKNKMLTDRVELRRLNEDKISRTTLLFSVNDVINNSINFDKKLYPGDQIKLYSKQMFEHDLTYEISGNIKSPGTYQLSLNTTIYDAIAAAGGIDLNHRLIKAEIARQVKTANKNVNSIKIYEQKISNTINAFSNENKGAFIIKPNDVIIVSKDPYSYEKNKVNISGYVNFPGDYVIDHENIKVSTIISRAGGLRENAYPEASYLVRNNKKVNLSFSKIIKRPNSKNDFKILPEDSIYIGSYSNVVTVTGEVNNGGDFSFYSGYRASDYIEMAGGITHKGIKSSSYVKYIDGRSKEIGLFRDPKIDDGSVIIIRAKEDYEPFNITEYVATLTSLFADISQLALLISLSR